MKILRYFLRGLKEIGRELSVLKSVAKPKRVELPRVGVTKDVVRYLTSRHDLSSLSLFDEKGTLIATTGKEEDARRTFEMVVPLIEETDAKYVFLRSRKGWITVFHHRGLVVVAESSYVPEVVDIWIMKRDLDRYLWGYSWEG